MSTLKFIYFFALFVVLFVVSGVKNAHAEDVKFSATDLAFFEAKVRPVLVDQCYKCHSKTSKKLKGGLRLDGRGHVLKGGETGPAIEVGKPEKSLLVEAILWRGNESEMPPKKKLKDEDIAALTKWVKMGAPWPEENEAGNDVKVKAKSYDLKKWRREYWAFQPVKTVSVPKVKNKGWVKNGVDGFILAKLEEAQLPPAKRADAVIFARRIYFDLIGLPPTPDQVKKFVGAARKDWDAAVSELVDELLASKQYGERWGRHWLDVARYSDGYGGFSDNRTYNDAWRYRDWVVNAFNSDMPFDKFIKMQIAGDLTGDKTDAIATGFFALGPTYQSDGGDPDSVAQSKAETLSDRLDTLSRGMLGMTLACARCHDHKFDPLLQQDYYSLAGIFNNTKLNKLPLVDDKVVQKFNAHQLATRDTNNDINRIKNEAKKAKRELTEEEKQKLAAWSKKLEGLKKSAPTQYPTAHTLGESGTADMHIAIRGNLRKKGLLAPRGYLSVFDGDESGSLVLFKKGSGRLQLAEVVGAKDNPLTMRVFVNRIWMHHFGQGLVRTPSNFGSLGEKPSHPKLLDWLTKEFIASGLSVKALHRTIMLSSTYQMSSAYNSQAFNVDGDNRLLWRISPRRLDAESWRDSILSVTGELEMAMGGPPSDKIDSKRRTLYFKVSRNGDVFATDAFLRLFDFPTMRATIAKRPKSIVPQQFLFLLNSRFMIERTKSLVNRLQAEVKTDEARIALAYELLYQRNATQDEIAIGMAFINAPPVKGQRLSGWEQYAQVLLSSNEFMYVR